MSNENDVKTNGTQPANGKNRPEQLIDLMEKCAVSIGSYMDGEEKKGYYTIHCAALTAEEKGLLPTLIAPVIEPVKGVRSMSTSSAPTVDVKWDRMGYNLRYEFSDLKQFIFFAMSVCPIRKEKSGTSTPFPFDRDGEQPSDMALVWEDCPSERTYNGAAMLRAEQVQEKSILGVRQ